MRFSVFLAAVAGISSVSALLSPHRRVPQKHRRQLFVEPPQAHGFEKRDAEYLTPKTKPFSVDGTKIPQVPFNIGESYAGTLPISSNKTDQNRLYFWFFPSSNPAAKNEVTIWLNGGPGCSSLNGLLQENGPFLWQPGTYAPKPNPYSWTNLTNMIYIDQPIGTGYSPAAKGAPQKIINEDIVASQFLGFWKNFMETFDFQGRKVYITGESYAGQYIPYIANAFLQQNNTQLYNLKGIQINDPSINYDEVMMEAPAVAFVNEWKNIFGFNASFTNYINKQADSCGYTSFMKNALVFPPKGKLPSAPSANRRGCDLWDSIVEAAYYINPCFNIYHIIDYCPYQWDVLGFPSLAWGPNNYFNQTAVKKAVNAPLTANYAVCGNPNLGLGIGQGDRSIPSALGPLPNVIEKTNNVIIGHGLVDFILLSNGSLATIQNMTWNGKQGFQTPPSDNFYVPYHPGLAQVLNGDPSYATNIAGAGYLGTTHTERGLTFVTVQHSGHEIPQYVPGAAYRQLEFLLGRIKSLTQMGDFTTQTGNYTGGMFY